MKKQPKNNNNHFLTETWISLVWQNPLSHEQVMAVVPKLFYMAAQFQGCKNFAAPLLQSRRHLGGGLAPPNKVPNPPNRNMKHYKPLGVCQTCKRPAEQRLHWERKEKRIPGQSITSSIVKSLSEASFGLMGWDEVKLKTFNKVREIAAHELYCCLLPWCEALPTCHSGFPIATLEELLIQQGHETWFKCNKFCHLIWR